MTLIFDLLASKSNQFIFIPKCTCLVIFPQAVCKILILSAYDRGHTDSPTTECIWQLITFPDLVIVSTRVFV